MARLGFIGTDTVLEAHFYEQGILFDPYSVNAVNLYDAAVGGNLITTMTPVKVGVGVYQITWHTPQTTGMFYDQWTWTAKPGMSPISQRMSVEITTAYIVQPITTTRTSVLESAVSDVQIAMNNLATKKELKQLLMVLNKRINDVDAALQAHRKTGK